MVRSLAIALEFRILGPLEVVSEGEALALGGAKQRALLALLLLRANEPVSVDRIVDELWGERPPPTAAKNVQVYVSHLRKALGDGALVTVAPGYALTVSDGAVDAEKAERALATAAGKAAADRAAILRQGLDLWRGAPLADLADLSFAQAEIARLEELRLQLLKRRIEADLELTRHEELVPELEKLVGAHPFDEGLRGQLMLALYRSGRQADALAVYRDARRTLTNELGLEPNEELKTLEQRILAHDPTMRPPLPVPTAPTAVLRGRPARVLIVAGAVILAAAVVAAVVALTGDASQAVVVPPNSVAVIDPGRAAVVASILVGRGPDQVVVGAGSVWVANVEDRTLTRIDPKTLEVTKTVGLGFEPTDLAGDENHLWVVGGYDHVVWRVDRDGEARLKLDFTERLGPLPLGFESGPAGIAVHGTSVWVSHGDEVTEFDADSGDVRRTVRAGGRWHREIATNGSRVWVGYNDASRPTGAIPRAGVDPVELRTGRTLERVELVSNTSEIVFDSGQLWVLIRVTGAASQLDPESGLLQRSVPVGYWPEGLVFDGVSLWVTNEQDGTLRKVDPETAETEVIPVGWAVEGVAAAEGRLFVAVGRS